MVSESNGTRDAWLALAASHMRVAEDLYQTGVYDVTIFHAYHAFECALCGLTAAEGHAVPPGDKSSFQGALTAPAGRSEHDARARLAATLITSAKPYHATYVRLDGRRHWRNESLSVEDDRLPGKRFTKANAEWLLTNMADLFNGIWLEIHGQPYAPPVVQAPPVAVIAIPAEEAPVLAQAPVTVELPALTEAQGSSMEYALAAPVDSVSSYEASVVPVDEASAYPVDETPAIPAEEAPSPAYEASAIPVYETHTFPVDDSPAFPMYEASVAPMYEEPSFPVDPSPAIPAIPAEHASAFPTYETPASPEEPTLSGYESPAASSESAPAFPDFTPLYSVDDAPAPSQEEAPAVSPYGTDDTQ